MLQSRFLSKRIEHHIQANHLIANYKALYFSGSYFQGQDADNFLKKEQMESLLRLIIKFFMMGCTLS